MRRRFIAMSVIAAFALSACGVKAELKKAPPLWGDKAEPEKTDTTGENKS